MQIEYQTVTIRLLCWEVKSSVKLVKPRVDFENSVKITPGSSLQSGRKRIYDLLTMKS